MRHQPANFFRRVKLPRALPLSLGKLPQKILVCSTEDVWLGVLQSEAMAADDLDECREAVVIERSLSALTFVVVLDVENALQIRIQFGDFTHRIGDELSESAVSGVIPYGIPAVFVRDKKPDDGLAVVPERVIVVGFYDFASDLLVPELLDLTHKLIVEHVRKPLEEHKREDEIFEFGASAAPRTAQAASQSQVSRVETSICSSARAGRAIVATFCSVAFFLRAGFLLSLVAVAIS